jgi:hypothetical protein
MTLLIGANLMKERATATLPSQLLVSQSGFESDLRLRMMFNSPTNGPVYFLPQDSLLASDSAYTNSEYPLVTEVAGALDAIIADGATPIDGTTLYHAMFNPAGDNVIDSSVYEDATTLHSQKQFKINFADYSEISLFQNGLDGILQYDWAHDEGDLVFKTDNTESFRILGGNQDVLFASDNKLKFRDGYVYSYSSATGVYDHYAEKYHNFSVGAETCGSAGVALKIGDWDGGAQNTCIWMPLLAKASAGILHISATQGQITNSAVVNADLGAIGTAGAMAKFTAAGFASAVSGTDYLAGNFGTTGYIPKITNTAGVTTLGNSLIYDSGSNVGIGTTTVNYKLEVAGGIISQTTHTNVIDVGTGYSTKYNYVGTGGYWGIRTAVNESFNIDTYNSGTPINAVSVLQSGQIVLPKCLRLANTTTPFLDVAPTHSAYYGVFYAVGSGSGAGVGTGYGRTSSLATNPTNPILMLDLTNERVGIGTTAPTSKLQVVGLPTYATNALAIAGGLTAGALYILTGTNALQVVQ